MRYLSSWKVRPLTLEGAKLGPMAGLLFFEDISTAGGKKHRINSNNAKRLVGTIYLPLGTLLIDAKSPVASESAYTAIVAKSIEILEAPTLILNTNYGATEVPVPDGIARSSQVVLGQLMRYPGFAMICFLRSTGTL